MTSPCTCYSAILAPIAWPRLIHADLMAVASCAWEAEKIKRREIIDSIWKLESRFYDLNGMFTYIYKYVGIN